MYMLDSHKLPGASSSVVICLGTCSVQAVSGESVRPQPSSLAPHVHFAPAAPRSIPHPAPSHTLTKRRVYIKEETVEFPPTKVGSQSILKVKVCNRDSCQHQVTIHSV